MTVKVYKQFRMLELSEGKFKINEHRKELRSSVKIEESVADNYNKQTKISGIYYELDEDATKERDDIINNVGEPKTIDNMTVAELRTYIKEKEYEIDSTLPKAELIKAIELKEQPE